MIVEQAFFSLPEFLVGTGFVNFEAEGTLVMAYAMAILQELNGRNVPNPVARVNGETKYPGTARTADLYTTLPVGGTLSAGLGAFGVRQASWIEAKFFRKNDQLARTLDPTKASHSILRDLIRLSVFPTEVPGTPSGAARYLLHSYEGAFDEHLSMERNTGGPRAPRGWLVDLHKAGTHKILAGDLQAEPAGFDKDVGSGLRSVTLELDVTTFVLGGGTSKYLLCLSRVDGFVLWLDKAQPQDWIKLEPTGFKESSPGKWEHFVMEIDQRLAL